MQTTWKSFDNLRDAQRALRGRTRGALELVVEQLYRDEDVNFVATAEVNPGMSWDDGVVLLSSQRLHAASCNEFGMALAFAVDLSHALEFRELQGSGPQARFKVVGLDAIQGISLRRPALAQLEQLVENALDALDPADSAEPQKAPSAPLELLKQLASLHDAGILTTEEFDAKKAEILRRM